MKNLLKTLIYSILILFSSMSMAAAERPADQAAACDEGISKHHAGPPGKGILHYGREDCRQAEIAAFERSTADNPKVIVEDEHEVMIGKPGHNRTQKNQ